MGSPLKSRRQVVRKGSVPLMKESTQLGCVSQDHFPKKQFHGSWKIGIESHRQILPVDMAPLEKFVKEMVHLMGFFKRVNLKNAILVRQNLEDRTHQETLQQERCARREAWDLVKNVCELKNKDKATFYPKKPEEQKIVVDSGASMHMLSKKSFKLSRIGNPSEIQKTLQWLSQLHGRCKQMRTHRYMLTILISS